MVRSMTGFGKGTREFSGTTVSVELSSVNHRYLEQGLRIPNEWSVLEPVVRETVKAHLSRGKVNVAVVRKRGSAAGQTLKFDAEVARQYVEASKDLGDLLGTRDSLTVGALAQFDGVFYYEENESDLEAVKTALVESLEEALERLDAMRTAEGEVLSRDLALRLKLIRDALGVVEERLPALNEQYEKRLRERIHDLNDTAGLAEERIAVEVAMMAEKGDVTEEVVRLKSHLGHAAELLDSDRPVGRELNFLAQEFQREINTLGAKVRDGDVARQVLHMKAELDKFREQIQNIE